MKRVELPGKGIGIVAERELKGVLGVYAGLVTKGNQANDLSNALYQFGAHNGAVSGMCVDAAVLREQGPVWGAGLLNHTCRKPNVKVRVTWIDGRPVVLFEAKRTIQAGEELVWDYNDGKANGFWMSRARCRIEAQEGEPIDPCRCGPAGVCPDGKGMIPIEVRRRLQGQAPRRGSIRSKVSGPQPPLQRKGAVTGAVQGAMGRVPAGLGAGKGVKESVLLGAGRGPGQTAWTAPQRNRFLLCRANMLRRIEPSRRGAGCVQGLMTLAVLDQGVTASGARSISLRTAMRARLWKISAMSSARARLSARRS